MLIFEHEVPSYNSLHRENNLRSFIMITKLETVQSTISFLPCFNPCTLIYYGQLQPLLSHDWFYYMGILIIDLLVKGNLMTWFSGVLTLILWGWSVRPLQKVGESNLQSQAAHFPS